ncbi:MAG: SelT/SelW/SelH family protein [Candidatus Latescibacteria bacterium]|nr:SelT/SelW/SelH family protein [Candidatus Latescibacterota bacterium]
MAEAILSEYKQHIAGLTLVPGSGGCFEVSVDGVLVFSKLREGRYPEFGEISAHL